jgi:alpha-tubulin suppressor-like RCC1 family protein
MFSHSFRMAAGYKAGEAGGLYGTLWTWGHDSYGQLGDESTTSKSSPIQTVAGGSDWLKTSGGFYQTAAIKSDGTLWSCGYNYSGELGDGTTTLRSSPVQTISGGTDWAEISCGQNHTAAIKSDGTLWLWGYNNRGQLGDNTTTGKSSPVQTVTGGTDWESVSCGYNHTMAIKTDGSLWIWGRNDNGQLGDNTIAHKSSPVQTVAGGTNWSKIAGGTARTAAIKTDGTLWSWGYNLYGQLGDETIANKSSPVQTIAGGTDWAQVACGSDHTVAIKTGGTLWTWGRNSLGQLGDETIANKSSPVQTVAGGTNWSKVAGGDAHTAVIKTDGTLWTWGYNDNGELGDETIANKSSPVQTVAGGTNWSSVSCGAFHTISSVSVS